MENDYEVLCLFMLSTSFVLIHMNNTLFAFVLVTSLGEFYPIKTGVVVQPHLRLVMLTMSISMLATYFFLLFLSSIYANHRSLDMSFWYHVCTFLDTSCW